MKYLIIISCLTILMAAGCKKNKPVKPKTELEKLPPITQTGANTFGCLINGKAWIPKDNYGQASFKLDADPTFEDGAFGVSAIKYYDSGKFESISFGSDSCKAPGDYFLNKPRNRAGFADVGKPLVLISNDNETTCVGVLIISRYDLQNRVFSGTFEFTLYNEVGDTIIITDGRFDKKL
jgi:hypothetical protein